MKGKKKKTNSSNSQHTTPNRIKKVTESPKSKAIWVWMLLSLSTTTTPQIIVFGCALFSIPPSRIGYSIHPKEPHILHVIYKTVDWSRCNMLIQTTSSSIYTPPHLPLLTYQTKFASTLFSKPSPLTVTGSSLLQRVIFLALLLY